MNHFMLPRDLSDDGTGMSAALRYGNYAMEILINAVLKTGCARHDLEIRLFGGSDMFSGAFGVGTQNARFAMNFLRHDGLRAASVDLGGQRARVVRYSPATGAAVCRLLDRGRRHVLEEERRYECRLTHNPPVGDVELF